jgi:heme A synthase
MSLPDRVIFLSRLWWVIPAGIFLATGANLVFFFFITSVIEKALLFPNQFPPPELSPLGIADVVMFSVIFSAGAGLVFAVIAKVSSRAVPTFLIVSLVVLFLSLALPLSIPSPPVAMSAKLYLVAMHVIGAIVVVGTLILLGSGGKGRTDR